MTAIALLNAESDPHLLADTLISADGPDPRKDKTVWLPALGQIKTEWERDSSRWHIVRLGRKSFFLPNHSGVLAYAGDCFPAFAFWAALSDAINNAGQYGGFRVDEYLINRVLNYAAGADRFVLFGMLIDQSGNRQKFIHKPKRERITEFETVNFGTCYVAGSGQSLLEKMIRETDSHVAESGGQRKSKNFTATENLAEEISSNMLFHESDVRNGQDPDTAIAARCGGFYEWVKIQPHGVVKPRPRIDIHISVNDDGLVVTRAYLAEHMESNVSQKTAVPSQRYFLSVLLLGLDPVALPSVEDWGAGCMLFLKETGATVIESSFTLYDMPAGTDGRLAASLTEELRLLHFPSPLDVFRIRMIVMGARRTISRGIISAPDDGVLARIAAVEGGLTLHLGARVMATMMNVVSRLK